MKKAAIFLEKLGMTQVIQESGEVVPVTVLKAFQNEVLERKTEEAHGYNAVVVGYGEVAEKKLNKPKSSYFNKLKKSPKKHIEELDLDIADEVEALALDQFEVDDQVIVVSTSKGKGFQGTIKAHGFGRGPMTHGSKNHRRPGSIGAGTDPARVFKGTKMGKRLGNKRVTVKNLTVVKVSADENLIFVKGAVPGAKKQKVLLYK